MHMYTRARPLFVASVLCTVMKEICGNQWALCLRERGNAIVRSMTALLRISCNPWTKKGGE